MGRKCQKNKKERKKIGTAEHIKLIATFAHSSKGGHLATQRMPPPLLFKGYCSQLSIKLKIQDGARRALGGLKGCRCVFLVIFKYVKEILYMWIKVMA